MVRKVKLSEEFVEEYRQTVGTEDDSKMLTAKKLTDYWEEVGDAYAHELGVSKKKAHRKFIESLAGEISSVNVSSLYNRSRVGRNIINRGLDIENPIISFQTWLALMRNIQKGDDGLIPLESLSERLGWYYNEMDNHHGKPPSIRDIDNHYRKNGATPEWEVYWKRIVRNAKRLWDIPDLTDVPLEVLTITDKAIKLEEDEDSSIKTISSLKLLLRNLLLLHSFEIDGFVSFPFPFFQRTV